MVSHGFNFDIKKAAEANSGHNLQRQVIQAAADIAEKFRTEPTIYDSCVGALVGRLEPANKTFFETLVIASTLPQGKLKSALKNAGLPDIQLTQLIANLEAYLAKLGHPKFD